MFFPREALYGEVTDHRISFSRMGGGNQIGSIYEFVGAPVPSGSGTNLVGEVHAKWYCRAFWLIFVCLFIVPFFVSFFLVSNAAGDNGPPVILLFLAPVWILFIFSMTAIQMRRSAEGFADYVCLVASNAFSK